MEWISVKDRLPDHGQQVIGFIPDEFIFTCDYDQELGFCDYWDIETENMYYRPFNDHVTHWMPLPEAPKQDGMDKC